jgi:predicted MFS family arabinose efflux permease
MFASSLAILADAFPVAQERAGAMAAYGATIGASFAVGPAVGGALTSALGWRAVFFINLPLGAIALLGTLAWVRESRDPNPRRLDWLGQITLSSGLFLLVLALLRGNTDGWTATQTLAELAGAVALLIAFALVEVRVEQPMLPLGLFRRRDFTAAQIAAFAISASFFALYLYMTFYLQNVLRLSPLDAGLVYLPGTLLLFFASAASSTLTERVRPASLMAGGLALVVPGLALIALTGTHSPWMVILPGHLLACLGTGLFNPALATMALQAGPSESSGLLAGVNDAFRQGGIAVGVAVFGALVPAGAALGHGNPSSYVAGFHNALLVGTAIAVAGTAATAALIAAKGARADHTQRFSAAEPAAESA